MNNDEKEQVIILDEWKGKLAEDLEKIRENWSGKIQGRLKNKNVSIKNKIDALHSIFGLVGKKIITKEEAEKNVEVILVLCLKMEKDRKKITLTKEQKEFKKKIENNYKALEIIHSKHGFLGEPFVIKRIKDALKYKEE